MECEAMPRLTRSHTAGQIPNGLAPLVDNRSGAAMLLKVDTPLLIVWHSRTGAAEAMARAAAHGAGGRARLLRCDVVEAEDLIDARGYLFACPENLAAMSGLMKEMFDRTYYPVLGRIEGRAYGTLVAAGSDGEGAQRQIDRIATGWRLRRVAEPLIANLSAQTPGEILAPKAVPDALLEACRALGEAMAEGLAQSIF
jgi:multimeric flavodoxin WrbA